MSFPSFTPTFHKNTYPALSPSRPEVSASGKTIIITGGGTGLGSAIASSFAQAGASDIALVGDPESALLKTKAKLAKSHPTSNVVTALADVSDNQSVGVAAHTIRAAIGAWDVFVNAASNSPDCTTLTGADLDDWWQAFEVNVKFLQIFSKHFMTKCRPNASFITISDALVHIPAEHCSTTSAYSASKLAALRLNDFLAHQYPHLRVFAMHPGAVETAMAQKVADQTGATLPYDQPELPADFAVWLASGEAEFLRGRFVWANWDVEELKARRGVIEKDPLLMKITIGGWPYEFEGGPMMG